MRKIPCILVIRDDEAFADLLDEDILNGLYLYPGAWLAPINPKLIADLRKSIELMSQPLSDDDWLSMVGSCVVISLQDAIDLTGDGIH